jgi:hypothetical protein
MPHGAAIILLQGIPPYVIVEKHFLSSTVNPSPISLSRFGVASTFML